MLLNECRRGGGALLGEEETLELKPNHISNSSGWVWGHAQSAIPLNWDN